MVNVGDSVTTTYTNITNKTGIIEKIYQSAIALRDKDDLLSYHLIRKLKESETNG